MAYSVLHRKSLSDDKHCGVWDSATKKWVHSGTLGECFDLKHMIETVEQEEANRGYFLALAAERKKMGYPKLSIAP